MSFIDPTPLAVCHNCRISRHPVFANVAQRGKNSMGWFVGFKLHLIVNECGDLFGCCLTPSNTVTSLTAHFFASLAWNCFCATAYLAVFRQLPVHCHRLR
ncbi:hypothetical protein KDA14_05825, partial [Candidatus Saccharibacteria bacterium]|nr:hypothetical protein [Candidatus Saccharibacteria bacterium]